MRNSYTKRSNGKVVVYAVLIAVVAAVFVVVMQDIDVPTEKTSQEIKVNLEN